MNVLIIEDHPLVSKGVKMAILEVQQDARICDAATFGEGMRIIEEQKIDILVLDIDIPEGEGTGMVAKIREKQSRILILVHSGYDEKIYALPFIRAGANGFLSKKASHEDFAAAWTTIVRNRKYVSATVQDQLLENIVDNNGKSISNPFLSLSPKELLVLQFMKEGKWNKEIAAILNVRENTVSTFKKRVYEKFGVNDERELFKKVEIYS